MEKLDFYARNFNFTIKKKNKIVSILGLFLSFICTFIVIASFFAFGRNFIFKKNPLILKSIVYPKEADPYYRPKSVDIIHNNILQFPFRVKNEFGSTFTHENLKFKISMIVQNKTNYNNNQKNIEDYVQNTKIFDIKYAPCKKILIEIPAFVENFDHTQWYCMDFESLEKKNFLSFIGSEKDQIFSYLKVDLFCSEENEIQANKKNNTEISEKKIVEENFKIKKNKETDSENPYCNLALREKIQTKLFFEYLFPESYVTPNSSPDPFSFTYFPFSTEIDFINLKAIKSYLSYDVVIDDVGWILEDFRTYRQFNTPLYRLDTSDINLNQINSFKEKRSNISLATLDIIALKEYTLYKRIYMKMHEVGAQIGGLLNTFHVFFQILVYFITDNMRNVLVNELFNIEPQKKKIEFNKKKNDSNILNSRNNNNNNNLNNENDINNNQENFSNSNRFHKIGFREELNSIKPNEFILEERKSESGIINNNINSLNNNNNYEMKSKNFNSINNLNNININNYNSTRNINNINNDINESGNSQFVSRHGSGCNFSNSQNYSDNSNNNIMNNRIKNLNNLNNFTNINNNSSNNIIAKKFNNNNNSNINNANNNMNDSSLNKRRKNYFIHSDINSGTGINNTIELSKIRNNFSTERDIEKEREKEREREREKEREIHIEKEREKEKENFPFHRNNLNNNQKNLNTFNNHSNNNNNSLNQSNLINNFINPIQERLQNRKKYMIANSLKKKEKKISIGFFDNFKRRFCPRFYDAKKTNLKYYLLMCDYIDSRLDIIFYFKNLISSEKYKTLFLNEYELRSFDYMGKLNVFELEDEMKTKKDEYYKFLDFFCNKFNHKGLNNYDEKIFNWLSDEILLEINNFNIGAQEAWPRA